VPTDPPSRIPFTHSGVGEGVCSDGISEDIIYRVCSKLRWFLRDRRNSSFIYKGKNPCI